MSRPTIQEFRTRLAAPHAGESTLVRAYRELTRRPDLAASVPNSDWTPWSRAATPSPAT